MIKKTRKFKSFTLIELLVAVSIFVVVSVVVIATLSISITSKSKILALNEVRVEGSKVFAEIQNMVEKGNYFNAPEVGVGIIDSAGNLVPIPAIGCNSNYNGNGVVTNYMDSEGWRFKKTIRQNGTAIQLSTQVFGPTAADHTDNITSNNIQVTNFQIINSFYRNSNCPTTGRATRIQVILAFRGITRGATGQPDTITLQSTFESKYPNPDKAGDSNPPAS